MLGNGEYRALARQAQSDEGARTVLDKFVTDIDADATEAIELMGVTSSAMAKSLCSGTRQLMRWMVSVGVPASVFTGTP